MEFSEATVLMESKVPRPESRREAEVSFSPSLSRSHPPSLSPSLPLSLLLLFAGLHLVAMETGLKRLSREGRLGGDASSGKPSCAPAGVVLCSPVCQQTSPKKKTKKTTKNHENLLYLRRVTAPPLTNCMKIASFNGRMEALALAEKHGVDVAAVLQILLGDR